MSAHRCDQCGEVHDLSNIEPAFGSPMAWNEVDTETRVRSNLSNDLCLLRADDRVRGFVRGVMPFAVEGRAEPLHWGVWVEVDQPTFERVLQLWRDPDQHLEPPFAVALANEIPGSPRSCGLGAELHLQSPIARPKVVLAEADHPLVRQQQGGVDEAQVVRWLVAIGVIQH